VRTQAAPASDVREETIILHKRADQLGRAFLKRLPLAGVARPMVTICSSASSSERTSTRLSAGEHIRGGKVRITGVEIVPVKLPLLESFFELREALRLVACGASTVV
jgi:hypothetical protein